MVHFLFCSSALTQLLTSHNLWPRKNCHTWQTFGVCFVVWRHTQSAFAKSEKSDCVLRVGVITWSFYMVAEWNWRIFPLNQSWGPEPFDTTFFDTDTILIPSSTEISIPILYWYYTGPIISILIRYRYFRGLKILILIRYRYFMKMVWYHIWYQKNMGFGLF